MNYDEEIEIIRDVLKALKCLEYLEDIKDNLEYKNFIINRLIEEVVKIRELMQEGESE